MITASLALLALALALLATGAGRFLCLADPLAPADAIVVLGGDEVAHNRVTHGAALYFAGLAPLVVLSGGSVSDAQGRSVSLIEQSRAAGLRLGLPSAALLSAPDASSTYAEARNLRAMAAERGWRSLIIVTNTYHSRRAAHTFRAVNPELVILLSPAPRPASDPDRWWRNAAEANYVVSELLKLGYYWLRYGVAPF